jgi:hypothetical protein
MDFDSSRIIIEEKTALSFSSLPPVNEKTQQQQKSRQQLSLLEGVAIPKKLLSTFQQALVSGDSSIYRPPFSYSRPLPPSVFKPAESKLPKVKTPRCGPIVSSDVNNNHKHFGQAVEEKKKIWEELDLEENSKMQHLQYNSPMQLYSSEAAEEQYRQQAASVPNVPTNAPIPLGAGHRQFDPSKSEALKAIRDQDKGDNFGQNFFDKISQAEAPNVPQSVEPNWANEARQKSERARSQTPGAYQHYQNYSDFDNYGIPHSQPPNFTSGPQLEPDPRASEHWQQQRQHRSPSGDRHHNPTGLASEKGYQFGGMDFIDHAHEPYNYDSYQYYDTYPKRKEQKEHTRPGYQYGLDFSSRARSTDGQDRDYYHGYGPQQPKLKPKFSADPHAPINTYTSYNVESVNPVRLIGDTISNQKIRGEKYLTDEEKRTFSTPFAPPPGFKRDHITVHPAPKPPEPICYSLSAKKRPQSTTPSQANQIRVKPRSRTPDASNNDQWYTSGNKEIMRTEPNWTRTVNSRRNAWEQQAQNTEARVQLPASAKVPPPQPPYWADRSHLTQNTWQNTASRLQNHQQWGANQSGQPWAFYNPNDSYANNVARQANQNFVSNVQSNNYGNQNYGSYGTQQNSQRTTSYNNSSSNNVPQAPPRQDYSSYNQQSSNYSSQQTTTNKQQQHQAAIPLPPPPSSDNNNSFRQNTTYSYQQSQPQVKQTPGQIITESSSTSKTENRKTENKAIPLPPPRSTGYTEQRTRNYEKTTEERTTPIPPPRQPEESRIIQQNDYNRYYKKQTTEQHGYTPDGRPIPPTRSTTVNVQKPEDFNRHAEMSESLAPGSLSNTKANAEAAFTDKQGHNIIYKRELETSADPGRECQLLKEEEKRVVEETLEPGLIQRHVTTKFYKKKTITDTSTTTNE